MQKNLPNEPAVRLVTTTTFSTPTLNSRRAVSR
jgi:hypothetical protein